MNNNDYNELIKQRKYHEVIKKIESLNPISNEKAKILITCYVKTKQYDKAVNLCQEQIRKAKMRKEKSEWQYRLADVCLEFDSQKSFEIIKEYLKEFKNSIHGHALAIYACSKLGLYGDVENYYKSGCDIYLSFDDNNKKKYSKLMAKLHKAYGEYLEKVAQNEHDPLKILTAIEIYHLALKLDNEDSTIWYNIGKLHFSQNSFSEAENAIKNALKYSKEPYIVRMLAKIKMSLGKFEEALDIYKSIPTSKQQSYMLIEAGQCAEYLKELKIAGKFYRQAIEKDPNKYYAYFFIGKLYKQLGAKEQAIENLKKAIDLCKKETGNEYQKAKDLLIEVGKMPSGEKITFTEKKLSNQLNGKIIKYNKDRGFGFIKTNDNRDLFFHISNVSDRRDKGDPNYGEDVSFVIIQGLKGPEAGSIVRIN
ncbi:MAG: cold shock domain-containing protein [Elusimicrobiota bacterium]